MESATKWKEYTASKEFGEAFEEVMKQHHGDNETRSAYMEQFLIDQALKIGVARRQTKHVAANPNRWAKHLAPMTSAERQNDHIESVNKSEGENIETRLQHTRSIRYNVNKLGHTCSLPYQTF